MQGVELSESDPDELLGSIVVLALDRQGNTRGRCQFGCHLLPQKIGALLHFVFDDGTAHDIPFTIARMSDDGKNRFGFKPIAVNAQIVGRTIQATNVEIQATASHGLRVYSQEGRI